MPTPYSDNEFHTLNVKRFVEDVKRDSGGKRMGEPMRMLGVGCFGYFTDPSATNMGLIGP